MDLLLFVKVVVLGAVEGLTEFLPVSSTGHLIIASDLLRFTGERAKTFQIFIQLGAILGVVWNYRHRLFEYGTALDDRTARQFWLNLFIAFVPAAIVGFAFHKQIKAYLFNPTAVAIALVVGGVLILIIERMSPRVRVHDVERLTALDALKVGVAQTASLFPGISRAGATIMGGLLAGLSRTAATEFSFFLAIPTMLVATCYELFVSGHLLEAQDLLIFGLGFVVAFVTALFVVRAFLAYVARYNFIAFGYYRIGFGLLVLLYFNFPTQ
ncbi:MAG: undecaprenyl-diphosphate phosphatase [Acidiferrobacterales bacterium]